MTRTRKSANDFVTKSAAFVQPSVRPNLSSASEEILDLTPEPSPGTPQKRSPETSTSPRERAEAWVQAGDAAAGVLAWDQAPAETPKSAITLPATVRGPAVAPAESWLRRYHNEDSRETMRKALRAIAAVFAGHEVERLDDVPWAQVTYQHGLAISAALQARGLAPSTVNRYMGALRGVMAECARLDLTSTSVVANLGGIPAVRESHTKAGRALSADETKRLYAACDNSVSGRRDTAVLVLTHLMGMRREEACSIDMADWKTIDRGIQCEVLGKGYKHRTLFLALKACPLMESWLSVRGRRSGPLLCPVSQRGTALVGERLTGTGIYNILEAVGGRAKVDAFSPHDLRRTYATTLLNAGIDIATVAKLMGHASVTTTQKYDKRSDDTAKDATDKLAEMLDDIT